MGVMSLVWPRLSSVAAAACLADTPQTECSLSPCTLVVGCNAVFLSGVFLSPFITLLQPSDSPFVDRVHLGIPDSLCMTIMS